MDSETSRSGNAVPAYVINVPVTVDAELHRIRRGHIETALQATNTAYRFVDAVDGLRLSPAQREALTDEAEIARYPKWLTPGVIGAALSHAQAYRDIVDDGCDLAVVLEDDAVPPPNFQSLLSELATHIDGAEIILLNWRTGGTRRFAPRPFTSLKDVRLSAGPFQLLYPESLGRLASASAYLVTRQACEKMLAAVKPIRSCTDTWARFYNWGGFDSLRCVVPSAVGMRTDFKSTIHVNDTDLLSRISTLIAHHRIFPIFQLLTWLREHRSERSQRYTLNSGQPFHLR